MNMILYLVNSPRKFKELKRTLDGITVRTLSKELKNLKILELFNGTVSEASQVTVESSQALYEHRLEIDMDVCQTPSRKVSTSLTNPINP